MGVADGVGVEIEKEVDDNETISRDGPSIPLSYVELFRWPSMA